MRERVCERKWRCLLLGSLIGYDEAAVRMKMLQRREHVRGGLWRGVGFLPG